MLLPSIGQYLYYVIFPSLLSAIPMIFLIMGAIRLICAKPRMTYRVYRCSALRIKYALYCSAALLGLGVAGQAVNMVVNRSSISQSSGWPTEILWIIGNLACLAIALALIYLQKRYPAKVVGTARNEYEEEHQAE